eukprot:scaffold1362_cov163-Amphora_coffeaeformis.AAC.16
MLASTRYVRYLRNEQGTVTRRIRQRFAALSSSAKDEDDANNNDTNKLSSPARKLSPLTLRRNPPPETKPGDGFNSIVTNFFANSPSKTGSPPTRSSSPSLSASLSSSLSASTKEKGSSLERLRAQRLDRERASESFSRFSRDRPSEGLSRFSRDRELPKVRPGSLREKFLPNSNKKPKGVQSILRSLPKPAPVQSAPTAKGMENPDTIRPNPGTTRPKDPADVSLLRSALFGQKDKEGPNYLKDTTSPLSEIIDAMRATKQKQRLEGNQQSLSMAPKWRATGGVRRRREEDVATNQATRDNISRLEQRVRERTGKSVKSGIQDSKAIQIPSYEMNLNEVSQLLRVSTRDLRRSLRSLGELPSGKVEDEEIKLSTEIVEYIALDLGINFERTDNSIQSDEEKLLQRRALAEKAEDTYAKFPPRPPVVTIMVSAD